LKYYFLEEKIWTKERFMGGASGDGEWRVWGSEEVLIDTAYMLS